MFRPQFSARVRHLDPETPLEIRITEDGLSSSYTLTVDEAYRLHRALGKALERAVDGS
jgi:hypothetical protein